MTLRHAKAAIVMASSLWTIGCAAEARSPEPIPIDRVECARCRMLISSAAGSGEILSLDDTRFYDDVGCLAADWAAHGSGARAFLRLPDGRWQDAQTASYARPQGADTAMGWGFVAFASPADATAADRDRHALTFADLLRLTGGHQ